MKNITKFIINPLSTVLILIALGCEMPWDKKNESTLPTSTNPLATETTDTVQNFLTYEDNYIKVKYYKNWFYKYFGADDFRNEHLHFYTNIETSYPYIIIDVYKHTDGGTIDNYGEDCKNYFLNDPNYALIEFTWATLSSSRAFKIIYTKNDKPEIKYMEIRTYKNDKMYVFKFSSKTENYDDILWIVEEMINSLIIVA